MPALLFSNIKLLVGTRSKNQLLCGKELAVLPCVEDAFLIVEDDRIVLYGPMIELETVAHKPSIRIDLSGKMVLPAWCDSHTHLVFAASREEEFVDKIKGLSYAEIASRGGGILNSANKIREIPEDQLFDLAWKRMGEVIRLGTGAVEIKSGYGLTVEAELKMLRVIKRLKERSAIPVKSTFLGAHAYPAEFRNDHPGYIDLIINEMLPAIAAEKLADYIDVFCENGFFSAEETELICRAGKLHGLKPKLHTNQLNSIGGIGIALKTGAVSVDHLEVMTADDIKSLSASPEFPGRVAPLIGTLLPTAAFFLQLPFPPARELINSGAAIALASDMNPGSSPSGNMNFVLSMACIAMRMLPEEAINAATLNGAFAMELEDEVGSITIGKRANLIVTRPIPSLAYIPYSFGSHVIEKVMVNGEWV
jgi:imidazolonepropionase